MPYRLEYGKRAAKCKGPKPCAGSPIVKGSLRLGTVVEIMGRSGFVWRHWGCTTAKVLGNLKEDAPDPEDLDGWENLTDEDKARVTAAYASGAVAPEDIPETARKPEDEGDDDDEKPKNTASKKKVAAKKSKVSDDDDEEVKPKKSAPKKVAVKKAAGSKKPKAESDASEEEAEALSTDDEKPKKKAAPKRKAQHVDSDDDGAPPPARAPSARSRGPVKNLQESDGSDAEEDEKPKKSSAKKARKSNATVDSEDDE